MAENSQSATLHFPNEYWAVFNLHANFAGVRAMKITEARFGSEAEEDEKTAKMLAGLRSSFTDSIMAIFEKKPNRVTQFFADTVFILANGLERDDLKSRGPQDDGIVYADGKLPDGRIVTFSLCRDTGLVVVEVTTNKGNGAVTLLRKQVYNGRQKAE
jgi:hypothetical protein